MTGVQTCALPISNTAFEKGDKVEDSIAYNPTLSPFSKAVLVTRVLVLLTFVVNVIGTVPRGVSESILLTQAVNK